jgi:hypothetical protein
MDRDALLAYSHGLNAVERIKELFPAFFIEYVAQRYVTAGMLLNAQHALIALVHTHLLELDGVWLDMMELPFPLDPLQELNEPEMPAAAALVRLNEEIQDMFQVWPQVYGIEKDITILLDAGGRHHLLALALWIMAEHTSWQAVEDLKGAQDLFFKQVCSSDTLLGTSLQHLPRLPKQTPMRKLCRALNSLERVDQTLDPAQERYGPLGSIIEYSFATTGNWFADMTPEELSEHGHTGIHWHDDLRSIGYEQRQARGWFDAYHDLAHRIADDPLLLDRVARTIVAMADGVLAQERQATQH